MFDSCGSDMGTYCLEVSKMHGAQGLYQTLTLPA